MKPASIRAIMWIILLLLDERDSIILLKCQGYVSSVNIIWQKIDINPSSILSLRLFSLLSSGSREMETFISILRHRISILPLCPCNHTSVKVISLCGYTLTNTQDLRSKILKCGLVFSWICELLTFVTNIWSWIGKIATILISLLTDANYLTSQVRVTQLYWCFGGVGRGFFVFFFSFEVMRVNF